MHLHYRFQREVCCNATMLQRMNFTDSLCSVSFSFVIKGHHLGSDKDRDDMQIQIYVFRRLPRIKFTFAYLNQNNNLKSGLVVFTRWSWWCLDQKVEGSISYAVNLNPIRSTSLMAAFLHEYCTLGPNDLRSLSKNRCDMCWFLL